MSDESLRYERRDFSVRAVSYAALGLLIGCLLAIVAIRFFEKGLDRFFDYRGESSWTSQPKTVGPPPQLQTAPALDLAKLRAREDAILGSYGWVDRQNGVIRIPIEEAMRLTAERGLPVRSSPIPSPKP